MARSGRKAKRRSTRPGRTTRKPRPTAGQSAQSNPPKPKPRQRRAKNSRSDPARLKDLLRAAEDRQAATADILKVIASSPNDVQPVFEAIVVSAAKLFEPCSVTITTLQDDKLYWGASAASISGFDVDRVRTIYPIPFDRDQSPSTRAILERRMIEIPDTNASDTPAMTRKAAATGGFRSITFVPLVDRKNGIGTIIFTHPQAGFRYSELQLAFIQTFADQAVIAIQNARLFHETQQALVQQTATAEILQVISSSLADIRPVFESILDSCEKLFQFTSAGIVLIEGNEQFLQTARGPGTRILWSLFPQPVDSMLEQAFCSQQSLYTPNMAESATTTDTLRLAAQKVGGYSLLQVPMFWQGRGIGGIYVSRRPNVGFSDKEVALLKTFADQAVIAIQNARLFNEKQEALKHQTATADVLKVISRSAFDLQPVLDTLTESAARLCNADMGAIARKDDVGYYHATNYNFSIDWLRIAEPLRIQPGRGSVIGRALSARQAVQIPDVLADPEYAYPDMQRAAQYRTLLGVPLLRGGEPIGALFLGRKVVQPFSDKQIELVSTFADQAVIAIENVRLFEEVKQRTRDLAESLEQQTATSEVLEVISSSPGDLQPVFKSMLNNALRICEAKFGQLLLFDGTGFLAAELHNTPADYAELFKTGRLVPGPNTGLGRLIASKKAIHIPDVVSGSLYAERDPLRIATVDILQARTLLAVPMLKDDELVGALIIYRQEVRPFSDRQIDLVTNFAAQAVIAVENTRLLKELRGRTDDLSESLQRQTATSDVLKVISRSAFDLQPVLDVIVETSRELCGCDASTIFLLRDRKFHVAAVSGALPTHLEFLRSNPAPVDQPGSILARVAREKRTLHYPNVADDPELRQGMTGLGGPRALLTVPLMRENQVIGAITLRQSHLKPFTDRQIEAIETFADQAVIAISNVGLFEQVQQRTRELSRSLDDLRIAQDRLIQTEKLASLGQLTAGIAHEIKNPLNFVNKFAALSAELTDELGETLAPAPLDQKMRTEVGELTQMLKSNLEKVVQHGKRADSIVKNMLQHSREGSGERRSSELNALVSESLNLAYHGARAERSDFTITLEQDLDPEAGAVEVYPQELTRALLNVISNGFYAAIKRKREAGGKEFEPVLSAVTKNAGNSVEIRIRDNGTGILPENREKIFNPFFTTKPTGEGTGLGLSMAHDIIVKQHGGSLDVATEPGAFTEFIVTLPRKWYRGLKSE